MTAIIGRVGVNKRPGELAVHSLDGFSMVIPDLRVAEDFYTAFGLDVREEGNHLGLYTRGGSQRWMRLVEGPKKKLNNLSFAVFEEDFEPIRRRVEEQGVTLLDPPRGIESNGFWFYDPTGLLVEVKVAEKTSPDAKSGFGDPSSPPGVPGAPSHATMKAVRPLRMAHVLVFSPDLQKSVDFYRRALGLRVSDRQGDIICFMHGAHGSDHHLVAFVKTSAPVPGLHHCSWDVGSINAIGVGAKQMANKGYRKGWGLGRHVLGSNYFHYMADPWGSWSEYSADIDYIPVTQTWEESDHPPEDGIYIWGPEMPEDFVHNYEGHQ